MSSSPGLKFAFGFRSDGSQNKERDDSKTTLCAGRYPTPTERSFFRTPERKQPAQLLFEYASLDQHRTDPALRGHRANSAQSGNRQYAVTSTRCFEHPPSMISGP